MTRDDFDPATDHFAVFPTPRPSEEQRTGYLEGVLEHSRRVLAGESAALPKWRGGISEDMLFDAYGSALHRICVDLLHRDLPAWEDADLIKKFRGVFGSHIGRLMVASYFGGVRERWTEATYRTNDEEVTLRRYYVRLSAWAKEREHLDSPEGLR